MTHQPIKLGGFKTLKGMTKFSLVLPEKKDLTPALLLESIAKKQINFPYLTCVHTNGYWGLNMLVESDRGLLLSLLIEEAFGKSCDHTSACAILSIFPHQKDPHILCRIINAFKLNEIKPEAIAISPSAISVVLQEKDINRASASLFGPFSFSAYRTPQDWKLAQKGKEHIYKDVIASYQEKRPKVYGLEYYVNQELDQLDFQSDSVQSTECFSKISSTDRILTFAASYPDKNCSEETLGICLSAGNAGENNKNIIFSMTGPHFGDRYGISHELLASLEKRNVDVLSLSCTIASITGVINRSQLDQTIDGIKDCFEVPMVVGK
ncbi:hypothetical protein ACFL1N_06500 [Thermodesulfobacteriota bacterium]